MSTMKNHSFQNKFNKTNLWTTFALSCLVAMLPCAFANKQEELNLARQIWKSCNTKQYYFELEVPYTPDPDSIPELPTQFGISVQDNTIEDVVSTDNVQITDMMKKTAPTVEGFFDLIQQAIDHPDQPWIDVTYNLEVGYPQQVTILYPPPLGPVNATASQSDTQEEAAPIIVDPSIKIIASISDLTPTSFLLEQLLTSKAAWDSLRCTDYDMTYQRHQYIPPPFSSRLQIQVRGGVATKAFVVNESNNTKMEDVTDTIGRDSIPTVDALFDELEHILSTVGPAKAVIDYNKKFNYPSLASIDISRLIVHEEFIFEIFQLTPIVDRQQQLNNAQAKWNSYFGTLSNSSSTTTDSSYSFAYQSFCNECSESEFTQPRWVRVENSQVVVVDDVYGHALSPDVLLDTPSIEDVFMMIQDAIDGDAFSLVVTYDDVYGYPAQVAITRDENIADDNVSLSLSSLLPISVLEAEISINKAIWNERAYSHYVYNYQKYCLVCPNTPVVVEVQNGNVVSVDGVPVVPPSSSGPAVDLPPTIDELFSTIEEALAGNVFQVSVSYDSADGFPTNIYIDYAELIMDEELMVTASELSYYVN